MPRPISYNGAIIRPTPYGTFRAEVNYKYQRHRQSFKSVAHARTWIDQKQIELANAERPLTVTDYRDARRALELLPQGVTLTDAVQAYVRNRRRLQSLPLPEAIRQFLAEKTAAGLREKTLAQYRLQLTRFADDHPAAQSADVLGAEIIRWLNRRGYQGVTRSTYRASFSAFWAWCIRLGYATDNPARAVTVSLRDDAPPGILTVQQTAALMSAAEALHPDLCGYLAVGLFAGLRPAELDRLTWDAITPEHVHVGGAIAKTRRTRYVALEPNLAQWVEVYRPKATSEAAAPALSPLGPKARHRRLVALRAAAGITPWPPDAMRHSFATYHLARGRDAARTAHELGHESTVMLFRHYRHLATQVEGEAYFRILPARKPSSPTSRKS